MKKLYKDILNEVQNVSEEDLKRERSSRVLIIDGHNTFIRTWTTNPQMNEDGDHVGGVVGSLKSIGYQIKKFNPTRVILTFDGKDGSKKRKKIHEDYKAGREKNRFRVNRQYDEMLTQEQERLSMKQQFVWLHDVLNYLPIKVMMYDGIEADDVIGYITTSILKENEEIIIVSTDKDFLQLVSENVKVFSPTKKKLYDRQMVFDEYGLWPENLLLFRTLDGDKSDNIQGIRGCGLKTFLKRFPEFREDRFISFDEFFELAEEKQDKIKLYDDVLKYKDRIMKNRKLMKLTDIHVPTAIRLKILDRYREPDEKFDKLQFIRVGTKYKLLQNWKGVNNWVHDVFKSIITE